MSDVRKTSSALQGLCCLVIAFGIIVCSVVFLVRGRDSNQVCFVIDALRERVPHKTPLPPFVDKNAAPPFAIGTFCFDQRERLVEWRIDETFQFAYGTNLVDTRLHGPLVDNGTAASLVAPVVVPMGLQRNTKSQLAGSSVIEMKVLSHIIASPSSYYFALYVHNTHATAFIETGRSLLMLSTKFR